MSLPPLRQILTSIPESTSHISNALALLFEPSPVLISHLVPQVSSSLLNPSSESITTYAQLIDLSISIIHSWPHDLQARFIVAHPRIGEVKGLSAFSATEQGQSSSNVLLVTPTPPEVLARLAHLNALYEHRYPGLRYITFVNGRPRAVIADEMEEVLDISPDKRRLSPDDPGVETVGVLGAGSDEWVRELRRAVDDIGKIAKNRLEKMAVE
ncbi:hypothetical protein JAAARDRAFT_190300 [Jaapia argillacea MUCL 33604]|uniref:Oxo-4-hydroxy-4-carboxy-5-ureidoimidazoline decarboxylase domain-containing protein n=1 Tax=Jaapia argillacea MUCL 33604 TaxID=933084 RepID=A0A067QDI6_9AGAM|nr:hypothetical protein JAAARDRAFT_190300 [Jaapia argillacea MUCL 33604]